MILSHNHHSNGVVVTRDTNSQNSKVANPDPTVFPHTHAGGIHSCGESRRKKFKEATERHTATVTHASYSHPAAKKVAPGAVDQPRQSSSSENAAGSPIFDIQEPLRTHLASASGERFHPAPPPPPGKFPPPLLSLHVAWKISGSFCGSCRCIVVPG